MKPIPRRQAPPALAAGAAAAPARPAIANALPGSGGTAPTREAFSRSVVSMVGNLAKTYGVSVEMAVDQAELVLREWGERAGRR